MSRLKRVHHAVAVMFLGNGFVMASSYSRMPGIRDQLGSTPTQLAFALVCMGIGSILGMPLTGRLVDRYSSRMISLVATVICLGGWAATPDGSFGARTGAHVVDNRCGRWREWRSHECAGTSGRSTPAKGIDALLAWTFFSWCRVWRSCGCSGGLNWSTHSVAVAGCVDAFDGCTVVGYYALYPGRRPASERQIGKVEEPIFDEPQVLASDRSPARSTAAVGCPTPLKSCSVS